VLPGQKYTPEQIGRIAWRQRWALVVPCAVVAALAAAGSLLLPNRYKSETVILVVPQRVPDSYVRSTVTSRIEDRLQSISQEILSRTRLERIITDFNLYAKARRTKLMEEIVERMRKDIEVQVVKGDSFRVSYEGSSPRTVADVTNRLASLFIEENLRDREVMAEGTNQFLESELEAARQRLVEHENKLEAYRKQYAGELPSQLNSNLQVIQNLQMQIQAVVESLNRNRDRRLVLEQQLAEANLPDASQAPVRPAKSMEPDPMAPLQEQVDAARADLQQLEMRLTPQHPDVIRAKRTLRDLEAKLAAQTQAAGPPPAEPAPVVDPGVRQRQNRTKQLRADIQSLDRQIASSEAEERKLRESAAEYQRRVEAAPTRETEMTQLMRDYATLQSVYTSLLQKREDSKMAANLERRQIGEQFKLLDPAKPAEIPFEPNRLRIVLAAAALGAALGAAFVGYREFRNTSLATDEEAATTLELPVLASVPLMITKRERTRRRWLATATNTACTVVVLGCIAVVVWVVAPLSSVVH
jgi:polysaccharide chain length determinant protein (PEP-CTERM system associated)